MKAITTKLFADLRRRRLQTAIVALIVMLASATGSLAVNLLSQSSDPFERVFAEQKGAHLMVTFRSDRISMDQLPATAQLIGASAVAGPWPSAGGQLQRGSTKYGNLNVFGRSDPGGDVGILRLAVGRWVQAPGEIVLTRSFAELHRIALGDQLAAISRPEKPLFSVVGEAIDINESEAEFGTQSAWVLPSDIPRLAGADETITYTMAYRFAQAPTEDRVRELAARIEASLPPGAVAYVLPYQLIKKAFTIVNSVILIFLLAFSVFALGAAAAIVANVVTGAVIASYREIGIMKAVGFSPRQVLIIFVGQMVMPALGGCLVGIPIGTLLSEPLLNRSAHALGLPAQASFAPGLDLLALAGVLLVVAVAATIPALRAGMVSPVRAITLGTAPERRLPSWLGRLVPRARFARPLSLGAGDAFARPLRGALTAIAILVGVATLTFAVGLHRNFERFTQLQSARGFQVQVSRTGAYPDERVMTTLEAQPETQTVVSVTCSSFAMPGVTDPLACVSRGDATGLVPVREGQWFSGPGEAVAAGAFLNEAHLKLGDSVTITFRGQPLHLRIVGRTLDFQNLGHAVRFDWSTLSEAGLADRPYGYLVALRPGSDAGAYARRVQQAAPDFLSAEVIHPRSLSILLLFNGVMAALVAVLVAIAAIGVFNTVLLNTRERIWDTALLKALGMTPGQVLVMVATSAGVLGLVGGLLGVPAGIALLDRLLEVMGNLIGFDAPSLGVQSFERFMLPLFALAGVAVAVIGALVPGRWAARTAVAQVLRSE